MGHVLKFYIAACFLLLTGCVGAIPPGVVDADHNKLGAFGAIQFAGDLGGTYGTQTVKGLQGNAVSSTAPTSGQALVWGGATWAPSTLGASAIAPGTAGQLLVTNAGATAGAWASCSQDIACSTSTVGQMALQSITPTGGPSTILPFNAGGFKLATTPWVLQDSGAVQRFSLETAHGRGTFGGGGSDYRSIVGPLVGSETSFAALYLLDNATAASGSNSTLNQGGGVLNLNALSTGNIQLTNTGGATFGYLTNGGTFYWGGATATAPLQFTGAFSTTPGIQSGTSATSIGFGCNKAGCGTLLNTDANASIVGLYGGTQLSSALGANLASAGHVRLPDGIVFAARNTGNTQDTKMLRSSNGTTILGEDLSGWASSTTQIKGGGSGVIYMDANGQTWRDQNTLNTAMTWTVNSAGAQSLLLATGATSFDIQWTAAAGAAGTTGIRGQGSGGTNDGGPVQIVGGNHSGASKADGSVKIVNAPFNGAFLSFTPANGSQTLNNAQSDDNFVLLNAGATNPVTINWLREIADTSCVWIKNSTSQTVTVAYLSGGTVTLTTGTSALVCSDGSNLQKIMTGTWLDPLDMPKPSNDNAERPALEHKEAA